MSDPTDYPVDAELVAHVLSKEFDEECAACARSKRRTSLSDHSDFDEDSLWSNDDISSGLSSVETSPYDVPRLEASLYYAGLSGPSGRGPKLIYRTSSDKFVPPTGPEAYRRLMKLAQVPVNHKLGTDGLWDRVREEVVKLLDKRGIQFSSVDLVRFTWLEENGEHQNDEEDEEDEADNGEDVDFANYDNFAPVKPVEDGTVYTTPVTIWVGVLPGSTTGEQAHHSANDILYLLNRYGITDVDIAYREALAHFSAGPELFPPVSDLDHLKDVIDNLSTALSLPIAGWKTKKQGTLGFYFRRGDDLYAVTARHVLFEDSEANVEYNYISGRKKEIVVMGPTAFTNYLAFIQSNIGTLLDTITYLETRITKLTGLVDGGGPRAAQSALELPQAKEQLTKIRTKIDALKQFFMMVKTMWTKPKDRVIGHVVWAPPISLATLPHHFTQDICVIKLDERKFRHLRANVLSLGPEIAPAKFMKLMRNRMETPHEFEYPAEGLLKLQGILSAEEICKPTTEDYKGDLVRRVIKRGITTLTTVGGLSGYLSHVRHYFVTGNINLIEAAIHPYDNESGPFSRRGDSGSIIVDGRGRFVALLTGGSGKTDSSDITFGTPMHWLWEIIKTKFPGASLDWDDDD